MPCLKKYQGKTAEPALKVYDVSGYGAESDRVVNISTRGKEHYVLTTTYRCSALSSSAAVLFDGAFTELCGGGRDRLFANSSQCMIQSIFELESKKEAFITLDEVEKRLKTELNGH